MRTELKQCSAERVLQGAQMPPSTRLMISLTAEGEMQSASAFLS